MSSRPVVIGTIVAVAIAVIALVAVWPRPSPTPGTFAAGPSTPSNAAVDPLPLRRGSPQVVEPVAGETGPSALVGSAPAVSTAAQRAAARAHPVPIPHDFGGASAAAAISQADVLPNGIALPPLEAPQAVHQIIQAGNSIARTPYLWGGGHGKWLDKGYDCSGSISYALASAGLLNAPLDSGRLMSWGEAGPGKWVTIYTNPHHVFMVVAGVRFDTAGTRTTGSRWQGTMRPEASFVARHPAGL